MSLRTFLSWTECFLNHTTTLDVFKLSSYERCTLSGFYMLKFYNLIYIAFKLNS